MALTPRKRGFDAVKMSGAPSTGLVTDKSVESSDLTEKMSEEKETTGGRGKYYTA